GKRKRRPGSPARFGGGGARGTAEDGEKMKGGTVLGNGARAGGVDGGGGDGASHGRLVVSAGIFHRRRRKIMTLNPLKSRTGIAALTFAAAVVPFVLASPAKAITNRMCT